MYTNILIATDGSDLAAKAVEHGLRLARSIDATAVILTVREPFHVIGMSRAQLAESVTSFRQATEDAARATLDAATTRAAQIGVEVRALAVEHSVPARAIIDAAAQEGCDLIVVASHGRGGFSTLVLGSVTQQVLTESAIPVLVLR